MALELWRPRMLRRPFRDLEREMEDMFGRFEWPWRTERGAAPAIDMVDAKDEIVLRVDLPGMDEKSIDVTVQDGTVTISGERKEEKEEKKEGYYYAERTYGAFSRTVMLPTAVDADKVKATFKKGVLEVHLPKSGNAKGRKIDVKAG